MVGSIGAVLALSPGKDDGGIEFVSSFAPEKRLNPFSEDEEERAVAYDRLQSMVDKIGGVFVSQVAALRGMEEDEIRATRGGLFIGTDAVGARLADGVGTLEQLLEAYGGTEATSTVGFAASGGD